MKEYQARYTSLLLAYADAPDERHLVALADLGQELVRAEVPTEVIGEMHSHAVRALAETHPDLGLARANDLVTEPLMELLMAYGLVFRDRISRTEEALQKKVIELARASRVKSDFLANMSHEIRTPMNAVVGMARLLADTPLNAEQREFVTMIENGGNTLLELINDVLDYSKIEADKLELEEQDFYLHEQLETVVDLVAARAQEKELEFGYLVDRSIPCALVGDAVRLRQVLMNLLSNAIKFTDQGAVTLTVERSSADTATPELLFAVTDTGIGIAPAQLSRIFDSFSQGDPSTTRRYGGTGLGLAISRRLVELMGGRIWVDSELGAGSSFQFTLPARVTRCSCPAYLVPEQAELRGKKLLMLSPCIIDREFVHRHTRIWGMETRVAESPEQLASLLTRDWHPHVIVVDERIASSHGHTLDTATGETGEPVPRVVLSTVSGSGSHRVAEPSPTPLLPRPLKLSRLHKVMVQLLAREAAGADALGPAKALSGFDSTLAERLPLDILVADDNPVSRRVAVATLARLGYESDVVDDGLQALAALRRRRYDVVLMDLQMPEMDGLEATRRIRDEFASDAQPYIVAMTASVTVQDRARCLSAGMDDYIGKPFRVEELVRALKRAHPA